MSWLRTNWLDALIFLLVALVMAGVVFFLTGVNPFSRFQNAGSGTTVTKTPDPPTSVVKPQAKPVEKPPVQPPAKPPVQAPKPVTVAKPVPQPAPPPAKPVVKPQPTPQAKPTPAVKPLDASQPRAGADPVVTVIPKPTPKPAVAVPKPVRLPLQSTPQAKPTPQTAAATPAPQSRPSDVASQVAPSSGVVSRGDASGSWQVSAGSFANAANAQALAGRLRARGWKAQVVRVGNYNRVYVGPYTSGSRARAAARAIGNGARAFSGGAASTSQATTPKATPPRVEIRLSSQSAYLQVGAYKTLENAQPAINKLKAEGYPVQVVEGKLVRVRVGPVSNKAEVRNKLRRLGFEVLEVR